MTKAVVFILIILLPFYGIAQNIEIDSIAIKSFSSKDYEAALYNFSVCEDENGVIYIANENGVLEYDGSEWKLIPINDFSAVVTLKYSKDGRIYVGGTDEFGFLERSLSGQFEYNSLRNLVEKTKKLGEVWQIRMLGNDIYFQTYSAIIRYDGELIHDLPIVNSWLLPINNQMHFSSYDKGIFRMEKDSLISINQNFKLKDDAPFKMLPGPNGEKLLLTEYNGTFLFDTINYSIIPWNVAANELMKEYGLYDGLVWDDSTYFFNTSTGGVMWVSKEGELLRRLTRKEGLSSNYMRESFRDSRGNIWLPNDGADYLTFQNIRDTTKMSTILRYVEVNDSSYHVNAISGQLKLKESNNSLVLHYATPGYDKADLEYSYYLEGSEGQWSSWNHDISKEYIGLKNQDYTFHVKSRLANGRVSEPASLDFVIPTLWYQSFWSYFFGIIILIVIVWVGVLLRMSHLEKLNTRLEEIILERTKELITQKEELRSANEELVVVNSELDNFVYRSSHDLVAPLKSLSGLISIAKDEKNESTLQDYFGMMDTSISKLEVFIKSILEYSSNAKAEVEQSSINLHNLIDDIVEDLKYFEQSERVTLNRNFKKSTCLTSDLKRCKIVLSNIIANAVKYHNFQQDEPCINMSVLQNKGYVEISIEDNGQGIDSSRVDKIFDMFYRASHSSHGSGLGLYIVKDTMHKLGGKISVQSTLGKGTTFTLKFPNN
jgi:signal transduction histidine kinase